MGPLVLFDKSFLQSLNQNEAALFDVLFRTNVSPVFFMETMADLGKKNSSRDPEHQVGAIAAKTPAWGGCVNASHLTIAAGELMGQKVKLAQKPAIAGGRFVEIKGKAGMYYKPSREQLAFERWQEGKFKEVERIIAKEWREVMLKPTRKEFHGNDIKFSDLESIRSFTKQVLSAPDSKWRIFNKGVNIAGFNQQEMWEAIKLWCLAGLPPIDDHAPYLCHLAEVDLFFSTAVLTGHICAERASNKIDSTYLYYLPFTQIFVSNDNLHARMTPHFLKKGQQFIWGPDLKADLKRLVAVFRDHPDIRRLGLVKIATYPPKEDTGLIAQLYDSFLPSWRLKKEISPSTLNNPKLHAKIMKQVEEMQKEASRPTDPAQLKDLDQRSMDVFTIERRVALRRGDWQFLPEDIDNQ